MLNQLIGVVFILCGSVAGYQHTSPKLSERAYSGLATTRQLFDETETIAVRTGQVQVEQDNETDSTTNLPGSDADLHFYRRCALTLGSWCPSYLRQTPVAVTKAPQGSKECSNNCNKRGHCNHDTGVCDCMVGWTGDDCNKRQTRPCTNAVRSSGSEPVSHIGPDGMDLNLLTPGWTASRCAGWCDVNTAACYCPSNTRLGHIPAPADAPMGTPPVKLGRQMNDCPPGTDSKGNRLEWGREHMPWDNLFSKTNGWCESENAWGCNCNMDGTASCTLPAEAWCPNQCSGHGTCMSGWCACQEGWYGHDCSRPKQGISFSTGFETERPWLKNLVKQPLEVQAEPKPATRRRPLIYIYDLPNIYNTRMKQYSFYCDTCTWRYVNNAQNVSQIQETTVYAAEQLLHEMLLRSDHRTFDPEQADFFYMPMYITCFSWPVNGWADFPWFHGPIPDPRVMHFTNMVHDATEWVKQAMPYWNRRGGKDHIYFMANDEGACAAPTNAWPGIFLVHWGRTDLNHKSGTAYPPDNYSNTHDYKHPEFEPLGWQRMIKGKPCYNPLKDLVIPAFKAPSTYSSSPFLAHPTRKQPERDILMFFRGDVGKYRLPMYSRRIRQRLADLSKNGNWDQLHGIKVGAREDIPGNYGELIKRSKFCLAAPGDGWSARFEDSVLHGCVPVIIKDNVHETFETILQVEQFSVRVAEKDLEVLPDILKAVSDQKLAMMQEHLAKVWHRFTYADHPLLEEPLMRAMHSHGLSAEASKKLYHRMQHDDAFHTIMQWLNSMIPLTR